MAFIFSYENDQISLVMWIIKRMEIFDSYKYQDFYLKEKWHFKTEQIVQTVCYYGR